ncbi:hypothetical protein Tco_0147593 [Tanacetum coccineum]
MLCKPKPYYDELNKVELSNLRDKIQKDNHNELVKRFSNIEVNHLNLQLKYQNLKESFENNTSPPAQDVPDFDSVFVIENMKASIQGKDNAIGTDNQEKDEKQRQNDKTGLGMEKTVKDKPNRSRKVNQVKTSTEKSTGQSQSLSKSTPRPKDKEIQV